MNQRHILLFCLVLGCTQLSATELVYVPVNPNFGGSPLNAPGLLNSAQATSKHKETSGLGGSSLLNRTPLQQFNESLERSILSRISAGATSQIFGERGELVPGTVETGNFRIDIVDVGDGSLSVTTTDKVTGASSSFTVGL